MEELGFEYPPYWDKRYLKNVDKLSKPTYKVKEERDVYVLMRDGVKLCVDIFRPDAEGKFPALLAWGGYGKDPQSVRIPPQSASKSFIFDHMVEAGPIEFFVTRGYAYIIPDIRGIGKSEGTFYGAYCRQEQEDCYDLIEWIAKQPWCDGNVSMTGISWYGIIQRLVAGLQPPHLKAIVPSEAFTDMYRKTVIGGIIDSYYWNLYHYCPATNSAPESEKLYSKEELERKIKEIAKDPDIKCNTYYVRALEERKNPYLDILLHPTDGPFWQARSPKYENIKIPLYSLQMWIPAAPAFVQGLIDDQKAKGPVKLVALIPCLMTIPEKGMLDLPGPTSFRLEWLRVYDYWLKGIDTGIMDEPLVKIFVMGVNRYRFEHEFPLKRTKWSKFYLAPFGRLTTESVEGELEPDGLVHVHPTLTDNTNSLRYSTDPLDRELEVTGPMALTFYCDIDQTDANFIVCLYDVFPDGRRLLLGKGRLKASHRALDKEKSKPWMPVHTHTSPEPVKPGEIYEYAIYLGLTSNIFLLGHRIELEIKTMDITPIRLWAQMPYIGPLPSAKTTSYKIYRDGKCPSHLLLPVIPETPKELWVQN